MFSSVNRNAEDIIVLLGNYFSQLWIECGSEIHPLGWKQRGGEYALSIMPDYFLESAKDSFYLFNTIYDCFKFSPTLNK